MKQTHRRALALFFVVIATAAVVHGPQLIRAQDSTPATAPSPVAEADLIATGEKIFNSVCIACHQAGGKGVEGIYPALAGDPFVTLDDPGPMVKTLLTGRGGMPIFGGIYNNEQIAAVVSYVRTSFGNNASTVSPEFVQQMRDQLAATPLPETEATSGGVSGQHPESPAGTPTP
jgi:mono/diheme cytochrome c family protein